MYVAADGFGQIVNCGPAIDGAVHAQLGRFLEIAVVVLRGGSIGTHAQTVAHLVRVHMTIMLAMKSEIGTHPVALIIVDIDISRVVFAWNVQVYLRKGQTL